MKQYYCHYCADWQDAEVCTTHMDTHGQKGVTFEALEARWGAIGGLSVRETDDLVKSDTPAPKSWMWDDKNNTDGPIVTSNFQHD